MRAPDRLLHACMVHEDSADGNSFRVMSVDGIHSGSFQTGSAFASNHDKDMVILPMTEEANGFAIDTSYSGSSISLPSACMHAIFNENRASRSARSDS